MSQAGCWRWLALLAAAAGCDGPAPEPESAPPSPAAIGEHFDPATVGSVSGRVTWDGPIPSFAQVLAPVFLSTGVEQRRYPHPNVPDIDPQTRAVRGAVVYLDGIEPSRSRPWDHAPIRVQVHEDRIAIMRGNVESRIGFVCCSDRVEFVSKDAAIHVLSARGAAFFGLPFPDPDRPLRRTLERPGLVDLSSAAGKYWHRAYLFVASHSYYALTDADGRFTLDNVPPGEYTLKCWLPNATVERNERDPNTGLILRFVHAPPLEWSQSILIPVGARTSVAPRVGN